MLCSGQEGEDYWSMCTLYFPHRVSETSVKSLPTVGVILAGDAVTSQSSSKVSCDCPSSCFLLSQEVGIFIRTSGPTKAHYYSANYFLVLFSMSLIFFYFKCFDLFRDCFTKTLFIMISNRVHKEIVSLDH